jgi:hypothetical protein
VKGKQGTAKNEDARSPDRQLQTLAMANLHDSSR